MSDDVTQKIPDLPGDEDGPTSGELPAYAPPPPKPTLSSLVIDEVRDIAQGQRYAESAIVTYWGSVSRAVEGVKMLLYVALAVSGVAVLLAIAALVLLAALAGHVR